jgi:ankyrin repeat protein
MEERFRSAQLAVQAGDAEKLRLLLKEQPELATAKSAESHPTLMQCVAVETGTGQAPVDSGPELARVVVEFDSPVDEPLIAAASVNNLGVVEVLLDAGADINGVDHWSSLEESLYWGHLSLAKVLLERGAKVGSLRAAAGLGNVEAMQRLVDEPGQLAWPFGPIDEEYTPQDHLENALIYAARNGEHEAVIWLLDRGARINVCPPGFHNGPSALHFAAWNGDLSLIKLLLERGADPTLKDGKWGETVVEWAEGNKQHDAVGLLGSPSQVTEVRQSTPVDAS